MTPGIEYFEMRRRAYVVGKDQVVGILKGELRISNIPAGAEIVDVNYSLISDNFLVGVESAEFDEVLPGQLTPYFLAELAARESRQVMAGSYRERKRPDASAVRGRRYTTEVAVGGVIAEWCPCCGGHFRYWERIA